MNADHIILLIMSRMSHMIMSMTPTVKTLTALAYAGLLGDILQQKEFEALSPSVRSDAEQLLIVLASI